MIRPISLVIYHGERQGLGEVCEPLSSGLRAGEAQDVVVIVVCGQSYSNYAVCFYIIMNTFKYTHDIEIT